MSTKPRLFDIDLGDLTALGKALGATQDQVELSYIQAMRRTEVATIAKAARIMRDDAGVKSVKLAKQRVRSYGREVGSVFDRNSGIKLWFGLNPMRVGDLRGSIPGGITPRHEKRDEGTGRYAKGDDDHSDVRFIPRGKALISANPGGVKFNDSYIGQTLSGRKTIYSRTEPGRSREASVDVYSALVEKIETDVFDSISEEFFKNYERDLRWRTSNSVHTRARGWAGRGVKK
ncbi:hypothetical protein HAX39_25350 [Citrobacter freundii]|nr:hypothetical protein [Citrobacter freundii]